MTNEIILQYNKLLENISNELDISESHYKQAEERYKAIGNWLGRDESIVAEYNPDIYPQGSFTLGTIIKPISDAEEYDIDLVCVLNLTKDQVTQKYLKELVGDEIKGYARAKNMNSSPKEGKRCWTLNYADSAQFHMDILPALPDGDSFQILLENKGLSANWSELAIAITDKTHYSYDRIDDDWLCSNPKGFVEWFKERMKVATMRQKERLLLLEKYASIEEIPEYRVKTPLQRTIQILKRHRDTRFVGHEMESEKPISMIVTTLSAKLYQNEEDVYSTLKNIVEKLYVYAGLLQPGYTLNENLASLHLIEKKSDGTWSIPNPVNPDENFADHWHENNHKKARAFFQWVSWVRIDLLEVLNQADIKRIGKSLEKHFGERIINETASGLHLSAAPAVLTRPKDEVPNIEIRSPSKPWSNHG